MKGCVTINTDAGFYPDVKIGSYAYWIKADGFFLKGSGIFKDKCFDSTDAERKAIVNALHLLFVSKYKAEKIIINRDNIFAYSQKKGTEAQRQMREIIRKIRRQSLEPHHPNYTNSKYAEFRHVKAHLHKNSARHWVNDWCDQQCKLELKKWRLENNKS